MNVRRFMVVAVLVVLGGWGPTVALAACSNAAECSSHYGLTESDFGAAGPPNSATNAHSNNFQDSGSTAGDLGVGTSASGGNVLSDDFETFSGWTSSANGGGGSAGSITQSNTIQHTGQFSLFKNTNADPSGGFKSLSSNVNRDWRIDVWVYKPSVSTNNTVSLGLENAGTFNGYSFSLDFGTSTNNIAIQKRTAGTGSTLGTAASLALSTNQWYRVIFASNGATNSLTLTVYDSTGIKQLVTQTLTDGAFGGTFTQAAVMGGFPYYIDDLNVYSSGTGYQLESGFNTTEQPILSVNITSASANLGILSQAVPKTATSTFNVKDYTSYGYIVQIVGAAPASRGHELGHMAGNASSAGTEQFGINLRANTSPGTFGQDPQQVPSNSFSYGVTASGYGTPNIYRYNSGDIIAQSLKTSGETDYTISYVANMSTTTPAGTYTANESIVVVATY